LTAASAVSDGFFFLSLRAFRPRHIDCSVVAFFSWKESLRLGLAFDASSVTAGMVSEEVVSVSALGLVGRGPEMERRM
jgi:hypothetical protein